MGAFISLTNSLWMESVSVKNVCTYLLYRLDTCSAVKEHLPSS
uniref:Uncharacterized protein n=1 Tax=Anguilla anguilla TaxID=7936 RepID=A0A0E9SZC6_ANGAN